MAAASNRSRAALSWIAHSFSLKLFLLAFVLLSAPILIYWQFDRAERERRTVLNNAVMQTGQLVAAMLRPHLERFHSARTEEFSRAVANTAAGDAKVKLLLRPAQARDGEFFYIASSPSVSADYLEQERRELAAAGIFNKLPTSCTHSSGLSVPFTNPAGKPEILTSIVSVHVGEDCWVVVTSKAAASLFGLDGLPFLETTTLRVAAVIYFLSALLVLWLFFYMSRNVSRFRHAARRIRLRRGGNVSFRQLNTIPELNGVAEDFDSLVGALVDSQEFIRRTAEERTHALKTPLSVIAQSVEPLRRGIAADDGPAQRGLQLIERSVGRLHDLLSSLQDMDSAAADVIYPERRLINLSDFVVQLLDAYDATLRAQGRRLTAFIDNEAMVYANEDMIETVMESLLENAASYTPEGGAIEVWLMRRPDHVCIRVADRGPGVRPENLPRIFDRYYSDRGNGDVPGGVNHQGLGLWIVRHNVEGLGGTVSAKNREGGGFEVTITLPARL